MYEPRRREAFEPQIQFAVMADWVLGDLPAKPNARFMLESSMLTRVARALTEHVGVEKGDPDSHRLRRRAELAEVRRGNFG